MPTYNIYLERANNYQERINKLLSENTKDYENLMTSMYYECLHLIKVILLNDGYNHYQIEEMTSDHKNSRQQLMSIEKLKSLTPKIERFLREVNKIRYLKGVRNDTQLNKFEKDIYSSNESQYHYLKNELRNYLITDLT